MWADDCGFCINSISHLSVDLVRLKRGSALKGIVYKPQKQV